MGSPRAKLALFAVLAVSLQPAIAQEFQTYDVVVYAANPAGIAASIAAADGGRNTVGLFEPLLMIGGMGAAGGVGLMNQGAGLAGVTGLGYEWGMLNAAYYNSTELNVFPELFVAERSFWVMLNATSSITVQTGCYLGAVVKDPTSVCVTTATFLCGADSARVVNVSASIFIDASYDGDIMVSAGGIDYAYGREAASEFNESLAGVSLLDESNESFDKQNLTIDAYNADGSLRKGVSPDPLPPAGTGDSRLMAFSYFPCVTTDEGNRIPFPPPVGYNASDFVLLLEQIYGVMANGMYPQGPDLAYFSEYHYYSTPPSVTKLLLCCGVGPVNCDEPDLNAGWANATHTQRLAMAAAHKYYLLGSLYFMANDARVPNYTRNAIGRWGLCADEYTVNDNWPPQIYVRISNRLRGETLLTQNNLANPRSKADSVSVGCWEFDQHTESRRAVPDPRNASRMIVRNEGYFRNDIASFKRCGTPDAPCNAGAAGSNWYDVPFGAAVPSRGQAANLLVPVAISSTSVAYSSTRIEGMYMDIGTACGVAAALALNASAAETRGAGACPAAPMQDTNVTAVQNILQNVYRQRVHGPINASDATAVALLAPPPPEFVWRAQRRAA